MGNVDLVLAYPMFTQKIIAHENQSVSFKGTAPPPNQPPITFLLIPFEDK